MNHKTSNANPLLTALKTQHYPYYLWVMLAPPQLRAALCAVLSFELELALIPSKVSEEMLGLIRYQWWEESVEMLEANTLNREHPVLKALELASNKHITQLLKKRITLHRTHFTEHSHEDAQPCQGLQQSLLEDCAGLITSDNAQTQWKNKASLILDYHAKGDCHPRNLRLMWRLLFA